MAEPHVVRGRLEGAHSLITQGKVMPELDRDGLASLLTDAISELAAYDSLRSQIEAEVRKGWSEAADPQLNEFAQQQAQLDADRLQAILDGRGAGGEASPPEVSEGSDAGEGRG